MASRPVDASGARIYRDMVQRPARPSEAAAALPASRGRRERVLAVIALFFFRLAMNGSDRRPALCGVVSPRQFLRSLLPDRLWAAKPSRLSPPRFRTWP